MLKRSFLLNLILVILVAVSLFLGFIASLKWITKHGEAKQVPSVAGKTIEEAKKILRSSNFDFEITDSVYTDTLKAGTVIRQIPEGATLVKINRTIYLTVNRKEPPVVEMPNLVGYSMRSAMMTMENMGLKLGDTTFRPDFAKNSVLEQTMNGATINPGTKIKMGTKISLVLGDGLGDIDFPVPIITGMSLEAGKAYIEEKGLSIGAITPEGIDKDHTENDLYIYQQRPEKFDDENKPLRIRPGQVIDVWVSTEKADSAGRDNKPLLP